MKSSNTSLAKKRAEMSFHSTEGEHYLGLLMKSLQSGTGKAKALPYAVNYIKELSVKPNKIPTVCEMGCGNGIVIAELRKILESIGLDKPTNFIGLDYNEDLVNIASRNFKDIKFAVADVINGDLKKYKRQFDIVLLINVLHEVFSFYGRNGESKIDFEKGKKFVKDSLANIKNTLTRDGMIVIVDGVDLDIDPLKRILVKAKSHSAQKDIESFINTYTIVPSDYRKVADDTFEVNARFFTRMITKSRFINSSTWDIERDESHEYYSQKEYLSILEEIGFKIESVDLLGPSIGKWREKFEILTEDVDFPFEYIIITATI